jgi:serine/threonine protein kinase
MLNQQIGNYKFLSVLGEGGMAKVYLAQNIMLDSTVAIKVLKEEFVNNLMVRSRFLDEAKKMVKVKHPNIIQVLDIIDIGNQVAIVMEYIEGKSLKDLIEKSGKLNNSDLKILFPQMLNALIRIHNAGFVHRDIKPSNFMLSNDGTIKLADFGIAKDQKVTGITETGTQMGTPMYMSPEQIKSTKDVDHRSDIYSLGVVLYEMVTGYYPYDKKTLSMPEIQVCILRDPLPSSNTVWDDQIAKATNKRENERFQKCEEWSNYYASNMLHTNSSDGEKTVLEKNNSMVDSKNKENPKTSHNKMRVISFALGSVILILSVIIYLLINKDESISSSHEHVEPLKNNSNGDTSQRSMTNLVEVNDTTAISKNSQKNVIQEKTGPVRTSLIAPKEQPIDINAFKPELLWNGVRDGGRVNTNSGQLDCTFSNSVPQKFKNSKFKILSYSIIASGLKGSLSGSGGYISGAHLNVLKGLSGGQISITVRYNGPIQGQITAVFNY